MALWSTLKDCEEFSLFYGVFAGLITHFQLPFPPFLRYSQEQCKKEVHFIYFFIITIIIPSNYYNNNLMIDFRCSCRGDQFLGKPGGLGA